MPRRALDLGLEGMRPGDPGVVDPTNSPYLHSVTVGFSKGEVVLTQKDQISNNTDNRCRFLSFQLPCVMRSTWLRSWISLHLGRCLVYHPRRLHDWVTEAATWRRLLQRLLFGCQYFGGLHIRSKPRASIRSRAWQRSCAFHWAEGLNYVGPLDPSHQSAVRSPRLSIKYPATTKGVCVSDYLAGLAIPTRNILNTPTGSRGWTFQETILLARSSLFITEMAWHWAELKRCECSFSDLGFDKAR